MNTEVWDPKLTEDYKEYCLTARSAPFHPSALRLSTALPPEVLRDVVDSFRLAEDTSPERENVEGTGYKSNKMYLTTLSLTCRDWASVVRPRLFHHLELKTSLDVAQLLEFLASPVSVGPPLSACIGSVEYKMNQDQIPPWIRLHDISTIIPKATMTLWVSEIPGQALLTTDLVVLHQKGEMPRTIIWWPLASNDGQAPNMVIEGTSVVMASAAELQVMRSHPIRLAGCTSAHTSLNWLWKLFAPIVTPPWIPTPGRIKERLLPPSGSGDCRCLSVARGIGIRMSSLSTSMLLRKQSSTF